MPKRHRLNIISAAFLLLCLAATISARAEGGGIPLDAKKHMARGQAAVENAENEADYKDAVSEFTSAAELAPQWADAYYNLGLAQEKAGQYDNAIDSFNAYIRLAPGAEDAENVQTKIFKLEYLKEKAQKPRASKTGPLNGEWAGTVVQSDVTVQRLTGEDIYSITADGNSIVVTLIEVDGVRPYSFFGNYYNMPIGQVIFRLQRDGNSVSGTYFQPFLDKDNPPKEIRVSGDVSGGADVMTLRFKESVFQVEGLSVPTDLGKFIILTMKKRK
ncbi:tetratricopeptide repeat protein [Candidatus Omnitrophota bacterium]